MQGARHANANSIKMRDRLRQQRLLAVLNAQWRGGSTLAEQLIFSTTVSPPFLLDEPARAMWIDENKHKVSAANFNALRCDFSQFNHSLLVTWQHWRGEFTRQRKLLHHSSFEELKRRCVLSGNGGHVRAIKTIRMVGELDAFGRHCQRERSTGNYSCLLIQLVRHPMATLRSERQSATLPQAQSATPGNAAGALTPGHGSRTWMAMRVDNLSSFCEPILHDLHYALALQRRRQRAVRLHRPDADAVPRVLILKYDDLLRRPAEVVTEAHELMHVVTSRPKLAIFLKAHFNPNATIAHHPQPTAHAPGGRLPSSAPLTPSPNLLWDAAAPARVRVDAPVATPLASSRLPGSHTRLRKRLKAEFGTVRPPRSCESLQPMNEWPPCRELLRLLHPLYLC